MRRQPAENNPDGIGPVFVKVKRRYLVNIAGVSLRNDDGSDRQTIISGCKPGEQLMLVREPDNKFDPGAVKVVRKNGRQLGYLPANMTRDRDPSGLANQIDNGAKFRCRVADITGGGPGILYGMEIEITDGKG